MSSSHRPGLDRQQLRDLAVDGAVVKLKEMEKLLRAMHAEWPQLFVSQTPPVLLAAPLKAAPTNGNGHWPPVVQEAAAPPRSTVTDATKGFAPELARLVAQHPRGITIRELAVAFPGRTRNALSVALSGLTNRGVLRRVGTAKYAPAKRRRGGQPKQHWTPAMRKAAGDRMRARHAAGIMKRTNT